MVLHLLADEFLHLVANDDVPTFNYVVGDLAQYYILIVQVILEMMMLEMMPEMNLDR